jgi:hypothetical protein
VNGFGGGHSSRLLVVEIWADAKIKSPYSAQGFEWVGPFGSLGRVPRALEMNVSAIV